MKAGVDGNITYYVINLKHKPGSAVNRKVMQQQVVNPITP